MLFGQESQEKEHAFIINLQQGFALGRVIETVEKRAGYGYTMGGRDRV